MKQVYIGIFAHPDDESFGPSGTLALRISQGADVHLICATSGQSGVNPDGHDNLGSVRLQEWLAAGKILGAKSQHHLEYFDGELSNNQFREIADKVQKIVAEIVDGCPSETEVTFVTMDQNGISGHIDHIVMSFVATFVFVQMREQDSRLKALLYYCIDENQMPKAATDFVFMPKGRKDTEIDVTVDITNTFEIKKQVMRAHKSQRVDAEMLIERFGRASVPQEYFYTYKT